MGTPSTEHPSTERKEQSLGSRETVVATPRPSPGIAVLETPAAPGWGRRHAGLLGRLGVVLGLVVLVSVGVTLRRNHQRQGGFSAVPPSSITVASAEVTTRPAASYTRLPGRVRCSTPILLSSRLLAPIAEIKVAAGQRVHKGEELVVLDDRDLQAKLRAAREEIDGLVAHEQNASSLLRKMESLEKSGSVARQEADNQREAVRLAEARLKATREKIAELEVLLGFTRIQAPVDGVVVDRRLQAGETAAPGVPLLEMYDPAELRFEVSVPESLVERIGKEAMTVELGTPPKTWPATLYNMTPALDGISRSVLVRLNLPKEAALFNGAYGVLLLADGAREQLLVPQGAVYRIGQVSYVDVIVDPQQMPERRLVELGHVVGDQVEVLSGLTAGERVCLRGEGR